MVGSALAFPLLLLLLSCDILRSVARALRARGWGAAYALLCGTSYNAHINPRRAVCVAKIDHAKLTVCLTV